MSSNQPGRSPIKGSLTYVYASSLLIATLTVVATVSALLYRDNFYPTEALVHAFVPNDVVILFIGLPILLGSMWAARRGNLLGLLFWPGALFFGLYNNIGYVFTLPLTWGFLLHLLLAVLSVYALISLVTSIDGAEVQQRLSGEVSEKVCGGVLAGFGLLFLLRAMIVMIDALLTGSALPETDLAVNVPDTLISPALMIVGIALWRHKALGYVAGLGLLFQASMLFVGLIVFLLLQPILTTAPFVLSDVIVVFVMGLICSIPFALFIRGVNRKRTS